MKTLQKSLTLLEAVAAAPDGIGVRELARHLSLNTTTVHGILATFARCGYLTAEGGTYRLGLKSYLLGSTGNRFAALWDHVRPYLEQLKETSGHTTACTVMKNGTVQSLGVCSPASGLAVMMQPGAVEHPHTTATGKYLLAQLSAPELEAYLKSHPLKRVTEKSITQRANFNRELDDIRKNDAAMAVDESLPGISALAAGLRDNRGMVLGAVGIVFPSVIAPNASSRKKILGALVSCARKIEENMR